MSEIPASVLDALETVRESGHCNLAGQQTVAYWANRLHLAPAAVLWLAEANANAYYQALLEMGARRESIDG